MQSRAEITTRYAKAYKRASKKDKGRVFDEVVAVTGWSRDNARRRLSAAASRPPGAGRQVAKKPRKRRADKFSRRRRSASRAPRPQRAVGARAVRPAAATGLPSRKFTHGGLSFTWRLELMSLSSRPCPDTLAACAPALQIYAPNSTGRGTASPLVTSGSCASLTPLQRAVVIASLPARPSWGSIC